MITLPPGVAALALGLESVVEPVTGVSTDTRTLEPGDLFVALRGDNYNGNQFVPAAFAGGAAAAVVEMGAAIAGDANYTPPGGGRLYRVADTREALGSLARAVRTASHATVVAVTGSVGKTSTKDLIRAMAGAVGTVVATSANRNNEIGVPLTLLELTEDTDVAVVEMGMRGRGQIRELTLIAEPDVAVVTAIAPVHLELVGTIDDVVAAKAEVFEGLRPDGAAVVPWDAVGVVAAAEESGARVVRFAFEDARRGAPAVESSASDRSTAAGAEVRGLALVGVEGTHLRLEWPGGRAEIPAPFRAAHRLRNTTAAVAACFAAGLDVQKCIGGLSEVAFTPLRGDESLVGGILLVDDTYNASPAAVDLALEDLAATAAAGGHRAIAVLGDMLELGADAARYHGAAGARAARLGVHSLWAIGPRSRATVEAFSREAGVGIEVAVVPDDRPGAGNGGSGPERPVARWVERPEEAVAELARFLRPGDVVLVKGSRGMKLDRLVEELARRLGGGAGESGESLS